MSLASATIPVPVWFTLPEGFTEIALDAKPEDRAAQLGETLHHLYPSAPVFEKLTAVAATEIMIQELLAQGAISISTFMYKRADGELCSGMLSAFATEQNVQPISSFGERLLGELTSTADDLECGIIKLAIGPVVLASRDTQTPDFASLLGDEAQDQTVSTQRQLEAYLPFPHGRSVLQLLFTTTDVEAWEDLLPVFAEVLNGVSFNPPKKNVDSPENEPRAAVSDWARKEFG
ncbi:hypothetical protein H180DRAFT_04300 [Streptomyces sp. WMMB 322]|nr:hypothetical protein H180DRAFT_04300 [Streptomyces sp. WMMB 322]